jgi:ClpP protease-like protein
MELRWKCALAAVLAAAIETGIARGDHIVFRDGHTLDGTVTDQDAKTMTLQVDGSAATRPQTIDKSTVKSVNGIAHDGPSYILLPVEGDIGTDISANAFQMGLEQALQMQPQYIVIFINSNGGQLSELSKMEDALAEIPPGVQKIAYVKKAFSAAAVLAMSCQQIYLKPDGVIGAAVPFNITQAGLPADVSAKFHSAVESQQRAWIIQAGHSDLYLRGMMDMNLELYIRQENGQLVLSTAGPGKMIKARNQILAMTAQESVDYGLARIASKMSEIGKQSTGGPWYPESKIPWHTVLDQAAMDKDEIVNNRVAEFDDRIGALSDRLTADQTALQKIQSRPEPPAGSQYPSNETLNAEYNADVAQCQSVIQQLQDQKNQFLATMNSSNSN